MKHLTSRWGRIGISTAFAAQLAFVAALCGCGTVGFAPGTQSSGTQSYSTQESSTTQETATGTSSTPPSTASSTHPATTTVAGESVTIFLPNDKLAGAGDFCSLVYPLQRPVPAGADRAEVALRQLLAGPTDAERAQGYGGWFSTATANDLIGVQVRGQTAYVDLRDFSATIPNASTSCGSSILLHQLDATTSAATGADEVRYAFAGDPAAFWNWLQVGCPAGGDDRCDPAPLR